MMRSTTLILATALTASLGLAGCSDDPQLMNIKAGQSTPDEFSIIPTRPLTMPPDLNQLPPPTPGAGNITDPTPLADAVAALGGDRAALTRSGIPAADSALIAHASRNGRDPAIRQTLASEDVQWRARHSRRLLEVWANSSVYFRAYAPMTLDAYAELLRWRKAGARTPSAPPK